MVETGSEFIMEVTDKTKSDIKGGTLIDYEGTIRLLELAQVPSEHVKKESYLNYSRLTISSLLKNSIFLIQTTCGCL